MENFNLYQLFTDNSLDLELTNNLNLGEIFLILMITLLVSSFIFYIFHKVLFFEDFIEDINGTLSDIFDFLEIDSSFEPSNFMVNKKSTGVPKRKWVNSLLQYFSGLSFLKNSFYRLFGKEKTKLIRELAMRKNLTKTKKGIDDKLRLQLESFFLDDVNKLKEILPLQNVNWLNNGKDS